MADLKRSAKYEILTALLCVAFCSSGLAADSGPLSGSAQVQWRQFVGTLKNAKSIVVYVGTERRRAIDPKPTEATVEIADFEFLREPLKVGPESAQKLTSIVSDSRSFLDYRGMKFCGGFHPDLCIEWQFEQDGQRWHKRAFVCLGCHEWRLIDKLSAVHTDMSEESAAELTKVVHEVRTKVSP
ncbi:MAG: hypothetical protein ABIO94_03030 [Opitutaceae bacterium]